MGRGMQESKSKAASDILTRGYTYHPPIPVQSHFYQLYYFASFSVVCRLNICVFNM